MHSFNHLFFFFNKVHFFSVKGTCLPSQQLWVVRDTVFSKDQQDQDNTHRQGVVMSLQGMCNSQMWRKHTERRLPHYSLLWWGHCFIRRVLGITSLFMLQLTLAKPLMMRGSQNLCVPASLRPTPHWCVAAIYNHVQSPQTLRQLSAQREGGRNSTHFI